MFCFPANTFVFIDGISFSPGFFFQKVLCFFIFPCYFNYSNFDALHNLTIITRLHLVNNKMNLKNEIRFTASSGINFFQNYKLLD